MKKIFIILIFIFLIGCVAQQPQIKLLSNFDPSISKKLLEKGNSTIEGSALIRQRGGGVVTCAGQNVSLIPVTEYSTERIAYIYKNLSNGFIPVGASYPKFINDDMRFETDGLKNEICDAQGKFIFKNIKAGEYYLTTVIVWEVGNNLQGGALMNKVDISENEIKNVVLSH